MLIHNPIFTGSISLNGADISKISTVSSDSSSFAARITSTESTASAFILASGSFSTRTTNTEATTSAFVTASGSLSTRVTAAEATASAFITASGSLSARIASNEARTGSFATTGSNFFIGNQVITGSVYIANDLVVQGSSSLQNITASVVSIGTNTVILNTNTPILQFGGISVFDSGSTQGRSGSLLWNSINDHWINVNPSGSDEGYNSAMVINGPKNTGSLGQEAGLTLNYIPVSQGEDHITDSVMFQSGSNISVGTTNPVSYSGYNTLTIAGSTNGGVLAVRNPSGFGVNLSGRSNIASIDAIDATAPMIFTTNDTERIRITSGGNVGIGFTAPSSSLAVNGNASIGSNLSPSSLPHGLDTNGRSLIIAGSGVNPNYGVLFLVNNSTEATGALLGGVLYAQVTSEKSGTNAATKAGISAFATGSGGSVGGFGGYMALYTRPDNAANDIGSYERMRIDMNGNVGIGSTSPGVRLVNSGATLASVPTLGSGTIGANAILSANGLYGLYTGVSSEGHVWQQVQRNDANSAVYSLVLQPSGGNVGIGITSPSTKLHIQTGSIFYGQFRITSTTNSAGEASMNFSRTDQAIDNGWTIGQGVASIGDSFGFYTGGSSRMTLTTGGSVFVGGTSITNSTRFAVIGSGVWDGAAIGLSNTGAGGEVYTIFSTNNAFSQGGANLLFYNATQGRNNLILYSNGNYDFMGSDVSDARLKQDIEDLNYGLDEIMELSPKSYHLKSKNNLEGSNQTTLRKRYGFIAQEIQPVLPDAITGEETETDYLGLDYNGVLAVAVKAIQELSAKVAALEAQQ
jgi:hypothetical protein